MAWWNTALQELGAGLGQTMSRQTPPKPAPTASLTPQAQGRVKMAAKSTGGGVNARGSLKIAQPAQAPLQSASQGQAFFDPIMAEQQRQLQLDIAQRRARLGLDKSRTLEDYSLLLPELKRKHGMEAQQFGSSLASRNLSYSKGGIFDTQMAELTRGQGLEYAQAERDKSRKLEDIELELSDLAQRGPTTGLDYLLGGARRRSTR